MGTDSKSVNREKKLFMETYGCQMNVADSEVVVAVMETIGYHLTDDEADADAVFVNTCSVRDNAEQRNFILYSKKIYFDKQTMWSIIWTLTFLFLMTYVFF